jgi:hypothetical protein
VFSKDGTQWNELQNLSFTPNQIQRKIRNANMLKRKMRKPDGSHADQLIFAYAERYLTVSQIADPALYEPADQ